MRLYHGSDIPHPPGTVLVPMDGYLDRWGDSGFFRLLETGRPAACRGHTRSVFLCDHPDDIGLAGGWEDHIFEVDVPDHLVTRHDMQWSSAASCLADEPCPDPDMVAGVARSYWSGEASEDPLWEYLAPYATVVREL